MAYRPRVRAKNGCEIRIKTYQAFKDESLFTEACFERLLYGLFCRRYHFGLEPVGSGVEACGTAKSSISRRFAASVSKDLEELFTIPLKGKRHLVLILDVVGVTQHTAVVALGITAEGKSAFWVYEKGRPRMQLSVALCWRILWCGGLRSHRACWW